MKQPILKPNLWTVTTCLLSFASATDAAEPSEPQRYRIVQGKGYSACEAFLRNVNAFPPDDSMACELKIDHTRSEFTRPQWEELDVQSHLALIYEAESLLRILTPIGTKVPPFPEWQAKYRERIASGRAKPRLRKTTLDLNGNGPETLVWYELPDGESCQPDGPPEYVGSQHSFGGHVFVQRRATGKLEGLSGLITTQSRTDILLYNGRPYFANAYLGPLWIAGRSRRVLRLGIHPVSPRLTTDGQYVVAARCYIRRDR